MKLCWSALVLGSLSWALSGCPGGPKPLPGGPPPEYEPPRAFPGGEGADVATTPEPDEAPAMPEAPPPVAPALPPPPSGPDASVSDAGATDAGAVDAGGPALAPAPGP